MMVKLAKEQAKKLQGSTWKHEHLHTNICDNTDIILRISERLEEQVNQPLISLWILRLLLLLLLLL